MPKTISLREEAYEKLKRARLHAGESFSDVVLRASWDREPIRAADFLELVRERGPMYSPAELDQIEQVTSADAPPEDKWSAG